MYSTCPLCMASIARIVPLKGFVPDDWLNASRPPELPPSFAFAFNQVAQFLGE